MQQTSRANLETTPNKRHSSGQERDKMHTPKPVSPRKTLVKGHQTPATSPIKKLNTPTKHSVVVIEETTVVETSSGGKTLTSQTETLHETPTAKCSSHQPTSKTVKKVEKSIRKSTTKSEETDTFRFRIVETSQQDDTFQLEHIEPINDKETITPQTRNLRVDLDKTWLPDKSFLQTTSRDS